MFSTLPHEILWIKSSIRNGILNINITDLLLYLEYLAILLRVHSYLFFAVLTALTILYDVYSVKFTLLVIIECDSSNHQVCHYIVFAYLDSLHFIFVTTNHRYRNNIFVLQLLYLGLFNKEYTSAHIFLIYLVYFKIQCCLSLSRFDPRFRIVLLSKILFTIGNCLRMAAVFSTRDAAATCCVCELPCLKLKYYLTKNTSL